MAVLSNPDRFAIWANYMSDASAQQTALALIKPDLRAAVNAIDDWVDANAASFNTAIPLPARTVLTAKQKAQLLTYVVRRRFEVT
jgi:hypothetical protein